MRYTFEESDIKAGMFVTRKNSGEIYVLSWYNSRKDKTMNITAVNSDGIIMNVGDTYERIAEYFNEGGCSCL